MEFLLETDGNIFTNLRYTQLLIWGRINKCDRTRLDETKETLLVNNARHSFFSDCEVYLNNEQVRRANSFYAHQAFASAELSTTKGTKECQWYRYDVELNYITKSAFTDTVFQKNKDDFTF